jgi:hypothetical protein
LIDLEEPGMPQLSNDAELNRAARNLINAHSSRAAAVAQKRAAYLDECGETLMADTWRQIGDAVRAIEARRPPVRQLRSVREHAPAAVAAPSDRPTAPAVEPEPVAGA